MLPWSRPYVDIQTQVASRATAGRNLAPAPTRGGHTIISTESRRKSSVEGKRLKQPPPPLRSPLEDTKIHATTASQTRRQSREQPLLSPVPPAIIIRVITLWSAILLLLVIHALLWWNALLWVLLWRMPALLLVVRLLRLLVWSVVWTCASVDGRRVYGRESGIALSLSLCLESGTVDVTLERGRKTPAGGVHGALVVMW